MRGPTTDGASIGVRGRLVEIHAQVVLAEQLAHILAPIGARLQVDTVDFWKLWGIRVLHLDEAIKVDDLLMAVKCRLQDITIIVSLCNHRRVDTI